MNIEIITVTPVIAKKYLGESKNFRPMVPSHYGRMIKDMEAGRWDLNGESIKFNGDGGLVDGQHRLMACVESGKAFKTVVVWGVKSDLNVDAGITRRLSDWLAHHGVEHYAVGLAAALRVLSPMRRYGRIVAHGEARATLNELIELWRKEQGLYAFLPMAWVVHGLLPGSIASTLFYLFNEKDTERFGTFLPAFSGELVMRTDEAPVLLHQRLLENKGSKSKLNKTQMAALTIIAWNHWRGDQKVRLLKWQQAGVGAQKFPEIQ